jgi:hypothetical protein
MCNKFQYLFHKCIINHYNIVELVHINCIFKVIFFYTIYLYNKKDFIWISRYNLITHYFFFLK